MSQLIKHKEKDGISVMLADRVGERFRIKVRKTRREVVKEKLS